MALPFPPVPDFSSFPFFLSCCLTPTTFPCSSKPQEGKLPWGAVGSSLSAVPTYLCLPCLWPPKAPFGSGFHVSCPTDHSVSFVVEMTSFQKPGGPPLVHKSFSSLGCYWLRLAPNCLGSGCNNQAQADGPGHYVNGECLQAVEGCVTGSRVNSPRVGAPWFCNRKPLITQREP